MCRRELNLILIIDNTVSMRKHGKLDAVNSAFRDLLPCIRSVASNSPGLEIRIGVIAANDSPGWYGSLPVPVERFQWTDLSTGASFNCHGKALTVAGQFIRQQADHSRMAPPFILLLTDSMPADDFAAGLRNISEQATGIATTRAAIAIGIDVDTAGLEEFTRDSPTPPAYVTNRAALFHQIRQSVMIALGATPPRADQAEAYDISHITEAARYPPVIDNYSALVLDAMQQAMGIEDHLKFIEELLERYEWNRERREAIVKSVQLLRAKQKDQCLYLGVVGEFDSGKSTLINALLRDELLKADIIPATTSAATLIRYGPEPDIVVKYKNGTVKSYNDDLDAFFRNNPLFRELSLERDKPSLVRFLQTVTAREEVARDIVEVTIYLPAPILKTGLVIIDTPGANVDNRRHTKMTGSIIRDVCDAAIVAVPADIPVQASLVDFLNLNFPDAFDRCIFIVTKTDLLKKDRERASVLDYIRQRLSSELEIPRPFVLPSAPQVVLDSLAEGSAESQESSLSPEQVQYFVRQFEATEEEVVRVLREQRVRMLVDKLSALMTRVLEHMKADLEHAEGVYSARQMGDEVLVIRSDMAQIDARQKQLNRMRDKLKGRVQ